MRRIDYIVIHHNGAARRTIEDVRRTHTKEFGWSDIGYHIVIHEDGTEHTGRPLHRPGAHVADLNAHTIGLCVIGNGNIRDFNAEQYETLITRCAALCRRFKLGAERVIGHRETRSIVPAKSATKKTCPGEKVSMTAIRTRVALELNAGVGNV